MSDFLTDYPENSTTTAELGLNLFGTGFIGLSLDKDWFRTPNLVPGRLYSFYQTSYGVPGTLPGGISISLATPSLALRSPASVELARGKSSADRTTSAITRFEVTTEGQYYLEAAGTKASDRGFYGVLVTVADDYTNKANTAGLLAFGFGQSRIASSSGILETVKDLDWFRVSGLLEGIRYQFRMTTSGAPGSIDDPQMILRSTSGSLLRSQEEDPGGTKNDILSFTPTSSLDIFLEARGFEPADLGRYDVSMERVDDFSGLRNVSSNRGTVNSPGYKITGSAGGTIDFTKDQDWFSTILKSGIRYEITLNTSAGPSALPDPSLTLLNFSGSRVASGTNQAGSKNDIITFTPKGSTSTTETYLIAAADASNTAEGGYTVSVKQVDDFAGTFDSRANAANLGSVGPGGFQARSEAVGSGILEVPKDSDWFGVALRADIRYEFRQTNSGGVRGLKDPLLTLRDSNGGKVAGGTSQDIFTYTPAFNGTINPVFYLDATSADPNGTGSYSVGVRQLDDIAGTTSTHVAMSPVGQFGSGSSNSGTFNFSGDSDWFRITNLIVDTTYTFLISTNGLAEGIPADGVADPTIRLLDSNGGRVAGTTTSTSFSFKPTVPNSTFYLEARSISGDLGTYTVAVI
jgi:hypothetical protein